MNPIQVDNVSIGRGQALAVIAGPCVVESAEQCIVIAEHLKACCDALGLGYIFKASFDKANRSSIHSNRGPGLDEGLEALALVRHKVGVPVSTDIHLPAQAAAVAGEVDLIQIPAFLCRQTDLLIAAAQTGKPVNVKKGQFMSPSEMTNVIAKLDEAHAHGVMLTERGTFFGYHRLINDFVGLGDMMELNRPVCFDVTHSTQAPGGEGTQSGGRPDRAPLLARCAVAAGVDALFIETHPEPSKALSDAAVQISLDRIDALLKDAASLRDIR